MGGGNWERQLEEENGERWRRRRRRRSRNGKLGNRAVGDKVKERPAEFLEGSGGFVQREVICKEQFVGYESVCVCLCENSSFIGVGLCRYGLIERWRCQGVLHAQTRSCCSWISQGAVYAVYDYG